MEVRAATADEYAAAGAFLFRDRCVAPDFQGLNPTPHDVLAALNRRRPPLGERWVSSAHQIRSLPATLFTSPPAGEVATNEVRGGWGGGAPGHAVQAAINALLDAIASGTFDPHGLLVAVEDNSIHGAIIAESLPGKLSVVLPPKAINSEVETDLMRAALDSLRESGSVLVQAYLEAKADSAIFECHGFSFVTQMEQRTWNGGEIKSFHDLTLHFDRDSDEALLGETLLATYEGTLDAPEALVDVGVSEILAGYRHGSTSSQWLVSQAAKPVGVLILSGNGEIQYLGVVPSARGRGDGTVMLNYALDHFQKNGIRDVTLTLDSRNTPACRLYDRAGFRVRSTQDLWIRRFE